MSMSIEKLRTIARAHDDYLAALRVVSQTRARLVRVVVEPDRQALWERYTAGYSQALVDLGDELVTILRNRMIETGQ